MNNPPLSTFLETREYQRFGEFCDACRRSRYIGLCYGPPGVGKTLSARHYTHWDPVAAYQRYPRPSPVALASVLACHAVFYTTPVVNSPKQIERAIERLRQHLLQIRRDDGRAAEDAQLAQLQRQEQEQERQRQAQLWLAPDRFAAPAPPASAVAARWEQLAREYEQRRRAIPDPTELIVVDEADRLKLAGLEQLRDLYDQGGVGLVLLGMPGLEKRLCRYPQLYSRVGFVHAFRELSAAEVRQLLQAEWPRLGVTLPEGGIRDEAAVTAVIRMTGGNFRLLQRLLTQVERLLAINQLAVVTLPVVEAARESLVIGTH